MSTTEAKGGTPGATGHGANGGATGTTPKAERAETSLRTSAEAAMRDRLRETIEARPLSAIAIAAGAAALLGGIVLSRWGRLAFVVVAGYAANELWHSEGRVDVDDLLTRLSPAHGPRKAATAAKRPESP